MPAFGVRRMSRCTIVLAFRVIRRGYAFVTTTRHRDVRLTAAMLCDKASGSALPATAKLAAGPSACLGVFCVALDEAIGFSESLVVSVSCR